MSTAERAFALPEDLLRQLSSALEEHDPASAVQRALALCALPQAALERVREQSLLIGERARVRVPRASRCEIELSLGVLLVLCGVVARGVAAAQS